MVASFLIFFREILEIAIILTIILAATRGVPGKWRWIGAGMAAGVAGSFVVAGFADAISEWMEGMGQEWFNGIVLSLAAIMIGWTVVWMKSHGRALAQHIRYVGEQVRDGALPLYSVATVVALAMWREGAEIVLFMYGLLASSQEPLAALVAGGAAGSLVAAAIGFVLYFGLVKLSTKHLFSVSGWLLVFVAAGMSAQAAGYFIAADLLPELVPAVWDSGHLLSENSIAGKILHALIGYSERPSAMQLLWYVGTVAVITGLMYATRGRKPKAPPKASPLMA